MTRFIKVLGQVNILLNFSKYLMDIWNCPESKNMEVYTRFIPLSAACPTACSSLHLGTVKFHRRVLNKSHQTIDIPFILSVRKKLCCRLQI